MEYLDNVTLILTLTAYVVIGYIVKSYLPNYVKTKGENKANKEDLAVLTEIVEDIKTSNQILVEENKSELQEIAIKQEKKRIVYEDIVESLRIFLQGHDSGKEQQLKFYQSYAKAWLWASDEVLKALDDLLESSITNEQKSDVSVTKKTTSSSHELYSKLILEMRKDLGFPNQIDLGYRFFQFSEPTKAEE